MLTLDESLRFAALQYTPQSFAGVLAAEVRRLQAEVERLRAELAAREWRTIDENMPWDEPILVGPTKRMGICVAMHDSRDGWVTETCAEWVPMYTPTHWMPLPPEPKP